MTDKNEKKSYFSITTLLLIAIIILELLHFIKLHEISLKTELINAGIFSAQLSTFVKDEAKKMKTDAENVRNEYKRRNVVISNSNKGNIPLIKNQKYDQKNNIYVLEISVPNGLKKEDIELKLNNNSILAVAFSGSVEVEESKEKLDDMFLIYRFFKIPSTKATINDIKYDINNNILNIIIPIIK